MAPVRLIALILIVAGILALVYRGFTYTEETHSADLGPLELRVEDKEHVTIPIWAGIVAIAAGAVLLVTPPAKS